MLLFLHQGETFQKVPSYDLCSNLINIIENLNVIVVSYHN